MIPSSFGFFMSCAQGLGLSLSAFFSSPLFEEDNLEP